MDTPPFFLASTSPQRQRLLEQMGLQFTVKAVDCDEDLDQEPDAEKLVELVTLQKMAAVHRQYPEGLVESAFILTSDTLVALDHHRLGKPANRAEAGHFLDILSGRTHEVLTGICLNIPGGTAGSTIRYACSTSHVSFRKLSAVDREWYLDSGEWDGAAGGYRIQGRAVCLIDSISGSYTGIVGLPIELVYGMLREHRFL